MKTINDINFKGKRALVRVDFNVPMDKNFNVTDDNRVRATIPTLKKILEDGGSCILMSHLGSTYVHATLQPISLNGCEQVFCL